MTVLKQGNGVDVTGRQVRHREAPRAFRVFTVPYRKRGRTQTQNRPWSKYRWVVDIEES